MSDTPETDASCGYALSSHYGRLEGSYLQMDWSGPFVHAEVARKLERERDEAREVLRNAIRFVEAYEPHSRGVEADQKETLNIIRKALEESK